MLEITTQLRGKVSESFVRKCLDEKYKDGRRSRNAKQQNQYHFNESKPPSEEIWTREEENSVIVNKDDNLALLGALDPDVIVIDSSGQASIQRGEEKAYDDDNDKTDLGLNINSNTKNTPSIGFDELAKMQEQELQLQPDLIECTNCKKLTIENLALKEALLKPTQFVSADKIETVNDNYTGSTISTIDLRYPLTFRSLSEYIGEVFPYNKRR